MKQGVATSYRKFQNGFSMVELMIAMVLSLVLIVGIIQVFNSSKQTYRTQDDVIRIQENGRFALDILERHIRMADYPVDVTFTGPNSPSIPGMYPALRGGSPVKNNAITGTYGTLGTTIPDSIAVRYYTKNSACGDALTINPGVSTFEFSILNNSTIKNSLVCRTTENGTNTYKVLLDNVVNMQIQYGIDGTATLAPTTVTRYEISPSSTALERVVSVRVALLIRGNTPTTGSCNKSYILLDPSKPIPTTDCYLYKVVQTTVKLRNRLNKKV